MTEAPPASLREREAQLLALRVRDAPLKGDEEGRHQSNTSFSFCLFFLLLHVSPNIKPWVEDHFTSRFIVWNFFSCCFLTDTNLGRITCDHRNTTPKATALGGKFLHYHKYPFSLRTKLEAFGVACTSRPQSGRRWGLPGSSNMPFLFLAPSAICLSPDSRLQSADSFLRPGCESPPCMRCLAQNSASQISQGAIGSAQLWAW